MQNLERSHLVQIFMFYNSNLLVYRESYIHYLDILLINYK
jgi:hypothetical protein